VECTNTWTITCGNSAHDSECKRSAESGQPHQIIFRNRFQGLSGLAPSGQSADDHERAEAFFLQ